MEKQQNLDRYKKELNLYQSLDRQLMKRDEMIVIDRKIVQLKAWISNLNAKQ